MPAGQQLHLTLRDLTPGTRHYTLEIVLQASAHCTVVGSVLASEKDHKHWQITQRHQGHDSMGEITLHGVAEQRATVQLDAKAHLTSSSSMATARVTEKILLFDDGVGKCLPILRVDTDAVSAASHSASVTPLPAEQLLYLQAQGCSPALARELIVSGFLGE